MNNIYFIQHRQLTTSYLSIDTWQQGRQSLQFEPCTEPWWLARSVFKNPSNSYHWNAWSAAVHGTAGLTFLGQVKYSDLEIEIRIYFTFWDKETPVAKRVHPIQTSSSFLSPACVAILGTVINPSSLTVNTEARLLCVFHTRVSVPYFPIPMGSVSSMWQQWGNWVESLFQFFKAHFVITADGEYSQPWMWLVTSDLFNKQSL